MFVPRSDKHVPGEAGHIVERERHDAWAMVALEVQ